VIRYQELESPVGSLLVVGSHDVMRLAFAREGFEAVLADVQARLGEPPVPGSVPAATQLDEYFAGERRSFSVPLDLRLTTKWRGAVALSLTAIPYGSRETYTELAARTGSASSVRACASACATNPLPVLLPCHRVVPASGGVGRYLGGEDVKAWLLDFESRP
jgi:methylated-DNA-[protein]-cysteine S-methyltransferase